MGSTLLVNEKTMRTSICYVLAQLVPRRLLHGFDGRQTTPRKLVSTLLEADRPVISSELDERAGITSRSRRDHLADLIEVGLIVPF